MTDIEQIRVSIERRLADLAEEVESLTAARAALIAQAAAANGSAPTPPPAKTPRAQSTARPPRRPAKRAAASRSRSSKAPVTEVSQQTAERLLRESGGLSASALAKQAGATYAATKEALDGLAASGLARASGRGRGSVWRLLTDEERIAARTAELEAQLAAVAASRAGTRRS